MRSCATQKKLLHDFLGGLEKWPNILNNLSLDHNLPENFNISDFDVFHSALVRMRYLMVDG